MDLQRAAAFFARSQLEALVSGSWVPTGRQGAIQPHDRFLSDREYGQRLRYMLVDPCEPLAPEHHVLRVSDDPDIVYLLGNRNHDVMGSAYSLVYLVHIAPRQFNLIELQKDARASGVGASINPVNRGAYYGDMQRTAAGDLGRMAEGRVTDYTITLPRDCPVSVDHELETDYVTGGLRLVVTEVYETSGLLTCRALGKNA